MAPCGERKPWMRQRIGVKRESENYPTDGLWRSAIARSGDFIGPSHSAGGSNTGPEDQVREKCGGNALAMRLPVGFEIFVQTSDEVKTAMHGIPECPTS